MHIKHENKIKELIMVVRYHCLLIFINCVCLHQVVRRRGGPVRVTVFVDEASFALFPRHPLLFHSLAYPRYSYPFSRLCIIPLNCTEGFFSFGTGIRRQT
jgi:hypothetical protein